MTTENKSAFDTQVGGDHYKKLEIQPAEYNMANNLGWAEGDIIGYVTRWKDKGGIQDLKKARHLLDMKIEYEEARASIKDNELSIPFDVCDRN